MARFEMLFKAVLQELDLMIKKTRAGPKSVEDTFELKCVSLSLSLVWSLFGLTRRFQMDFADTLQEIQDTAQDDEYLDRFRLQRRLFKWLEFVQRAFLENKLEPAQKLLRCGDSNAFGAGTLGTKSEQKLRQSHKFEFLEIPEKVQCGDGHFQTKADFLRDIQTLLTLKDTFCGEQASPNDVDTQIRKFLELKDRHQFKSLSRFCVNVLDFIGQVGDRKVDKVDLSKGCGFSVTADLVVSYLSLHLISCKVPVGLVSGSLEGNQQEVLNTNQQKSSKLMKDIDPTKPITPETNNTKPGLFSSGFTQGPQKKSLLGNIPKKSGLGFSGGTFPFANSLQPPTTVAASKPNLFGLNQKASDKKQKDKNPFSFDKATPGFGGLKFANMAQKTEPKKPNVFSGFNKEINSGSSLFPKSTPQGSTTGKEKSLVFGKPQVLNEPGTNTLKFDSTKNTMFKGNTQVFPSNPLTASKTKQPLWKPDLQPKPGFMGSIINKNPPSFSLYPKTVSKPLQLQKNQGALLTQSKPTIHQKQETPDPKNKSLVLSPLCFASSKYFSHLLEHALVTKQFELGMALVCFTPLAPHKRDFYERRVYDLMSLESLPPRRLRVDRLKYSSACRAFADENYKTSRLLKYLPCREYRKAILYMLAVGRVPEAVSLFLFQVLRPQLESKVFCPESWEKIEKLFDKVYNEQKAEAASLLPFVGCFLGLVRMLKGVSDLKSSRVDLLDTYFSQMEGALMLDISSAHNGLVLLMNSVMLGLLLRVQSIRSDLSRAFAEAFGRSDIGYPMKNQDLSFALLQLVDSFSK